MLTESLICAGAIGITLFLTYRVSKREAAEKRMLRDQASKSYWKMREAIDQLQDHADRWAAARTLIEGVRQHEDMMFARGLDL